MEKVSRFFNTTGPCNPEDHYMLPPEDRLLGAQLDRYIKYKLYWVLHAPRQTGKTTFLQSWMRKINASKEAVSCYVSVERCQQFTEAKDSMPAICEAIRSYSETFLGASYVPDLPQIGPESMLDRILKNWAALVAPKPLVVLFDEVDVLQDQAMVSFLRQLRGGFAMRGIGHFPVSIALVGMRDLRDYLIESKDGTPLNPGSPFNIKEDSITIGNFVSGDIVKLASQHTDETGQEFSEEALNRIWELTKGQPWLVNSLLKKCIWKLQPNGEPIGLEHIDQAKEMLIEERSVHLDSLAERLKDPRVKRIIQTMLTGESDPTLTEGDDFRLTQDLGLVVKEAGTPSIANPVYREVISRVLSQGMQDAIPAPEFKWKNDDGTLDMDALLREFQRFWRRHADIWEQKAEYTEAFPHLLLMAFLQRVINGGGQVEREYAAGRGRVDLAIEYGGAWSIIEIKMINPHDGRNLTLEEGLEQIARYRDTIDPEALAYLVIFDRTENGRRKTWEERLTHEEKHSPDGKPVLVIGG